jgi:hypothetical protein
MDSVDARKKAIGQRLGRLERERAKYQQEKSKAQAILDEPEGNEREEYEALREQRVRLLVLRPSISGYRWSWMRRLTFLARTRSQGSRDWS